jgi:phage repressor protein C with HTH and peptisase S24 domain
MTPVSERLQEFFNAEKLNPLGVSELLQYDSAEKLYRLFRNKNANPSLEILVDITNKFENLNVDWLLTGNGSMYKNKPPLPPQSLVDFRNKQVHNQSVNTVNPEHFSQKTTQKTTPDTTPKAKNDYNFQGFPPQNFEENEVKYHFGVPRVVTVTETRQDNIVYVPIKARAGYLTGYGDPEYISTLPTLRIPGLNNATYRMFEIDGPSMGPNIVHGDRIICEWVGSLDEIRDNRVYVVVSRNGVVCKRVLNRVKEYGKLILKSDTISQKKDYPNIDLELEDINEIWYSRMKLSTDFSEPAEVYHRLNDFEAEMTVLRSDFKRISKDIDKLKEDKGPF